MGKITMFESTYNLACTNGTILGTHHYCFTTDIYVKQVPDVAFSFSLLSDYQLMRERSKISDVRCIIFGLNKLLR